MASALSQQKDNVEGRLEIQKYSGKSSCTTQTSKPYDSFTFTRLMNES